ncbi:hypothetical protein [Mucilaginibacter sp.]|uniref:hypothetical protein n=1 Tax=Mucilaginibacter sp. TaxID=1882438 RepID=UPI003B0038AE
MKKELIVLTLFLSNIFYCYSNTVSFPTINNFISNSYKDTTFILKEKDSSYYHKIYIEKNRKSNYYKLLTNFKFSKGDLEFINEYYKLFKKRSAPVKKFNLQNIVKEWLPLYKYKDKYYLYAPSDWGNRKMITNSLLFYWYLDGPYPCILTSFSKINLNHYKLTSKDFFDNSDVYVKPAKLSIYIIDLKKNISVWKYWNKKGEYRYGLFVSKEHAKAFDIVVNYCKESKVPEFDFDKIDFKKLLNEK